MRSNLAVRAVTILGLGLAGLVGGHALGYGVAVPDDLHRTILLDATGHGYMPSASRFAIMLGIAAVITGILAGYLHRPATSQPAFMKVAGRMALLQCLGFVVLEVAERIVASASMSTLSLSVLLVGLLSQAVVAFVLALLIVGLRRLGAALRTSPAVVTDAGRPEFVVVSQHVPFSRTRLRDRVRGPPAVQMV